jgi:hypothetical protein
VVLAAVVDVVVAAVVEVVDALVVDVVLACVVVVVDALVVDVVLACVVVVVLACVVDVVVARVVLVVATRVVVVVLTPQPLPVHASQQLGVDATQAVPPLGALHAATRHLMLHWVTPRELVRQQATAPVLPHVDWAAHLTTLSLHSRGSRAAFTSASATWETQRT